MRRLVYSPKVYAFVRTDDTISGTPPYLDISDYIVRGNVTRLVGSASTATLTLRNPNKIFTGNNAGRTPTFHPMDPITIYMSRYEDFPVQVFTGYLDKTPYLQLFPGTVQLQASCTLKRLLHTYWDPALSFTKQFMAKYGWFQDQNTGQMQNVAEQVTSLEDKGKLSDGSIGQVLYAVLTEPRLGNWKDNEVFIEQLPPDLIRRIKNIYMKFAQDQKELEAQLTTLLSQIVGSGANGSGGGNPNGAATPSGEVLGLDKIVPAMEAISNQYNVPPELTIAVYLIEWGKAGNKDRPDGTYTGYFQQQHANPPYAYGTMSKKAPTVAETHDLTIATTGFVTAAAGLAQAHPEFKNDLYSWAINTQGVENNLSRQSPDYRYAAQFEQVVAEAKADLTKYGKNPIAPTLTGTTVTKPATKSKAATTTAGARTGTIYEAIVAEANRLDSINAPYNNSRPPSDTAGYDCSSSCATLLRAAGISVPFFSTVDAPNYMTPGEDPSGRLTFWNDDINSVGGNSVHIFATIGGRDWGTSHENPGGGPGFTSTHPKTGFRPYHLKRNLDSPASLPIDANTDVPGGSTSGTPGSVLNDTTATAFANQVSWPGVEESSEAVLLQGDKSLMNDKQIMPFIQELTSAALRQFQSLPNGDFFAFFPDYFGDFNHRKPYWKIDDIEILDGKIELTDDALATHVYIAGDTGVPFDGVNFYDQILSGGVVTIFNAFESGFVLGSDDETPSKSSFDARNHKSRLLAERADAVKFLQKYGARPYYEPVPAIRSHFYEAFYAFQTFQLLWSRTFLTEFQFTFMPEVYPGGIVAFEDHNLQCYVDSVSHDFDYEAGFTTTAQLSAPAYYDPTGKGRDPLGLSRGLVRASPNL